MTTNKQRGFTLIELLVVLAIIGILAGLLTPSLIAARKNADRKTCASTIQSLDLYLSSYLNDFGDYPPTDLELEYGDTFGVTTNGINSGVESLVAHLYTQNKGGPYPELKEDWIANRDDDHLSSSELIKELNWVFGNDELREFVDPWGNPLVYFHSRDYDREFQVQEDVDSGEGKTGTAIGAMSTTFATYQNPTGYQIWSLGPDGKTQNGVEESDDIGSW